MLMKDQVLERIKTEIEKAKNHHKNVGELVKLTDESYSVTVTIDGAADSPFEGGEYSFAVIYDIRVYPFKSPVIDFLSAIHHPNIKGKCTWIEFFYEKWTPILTLSSIITSMQDLLINPRINGNRNWAAHLDYTYDSKRYLAENQALISARKSSPD